MPSSLDVADEHAVANARGHRIGIALDGSAVSAKVRQSLETAVSPASLRF